LLSSIVLLAILSKKLPSFAALPAALIALTLIGQRPLSGKPLEIPKLDVPAQERVVFASQDWDMARTPKAHMPPNIASLARVHDLFGYDSILDAGFVSKLQTALGESPAPQENGNMMLLRGKGGVTSDQQKSFETMGVSSGQSGLVRSWRIMTGKKDTSTVFIPARASIEYDGYDHQIIKVQILEGVEPVTQILVRDRYFEGMTSPTPGVTIENQDGWRLIKTDGKQPVIRIDYPGRKNYIGVIIGIAILLLGYLFTTRKNEPNPTAS
jgi:hypothetical protein